MAGGAGANVFNVSGYLATGKLTGVGGNDVLIVNKDVATVTLTDIRVIGSDGLNMVLDSIGTANLTGGPSNNTFTVNAWTGVGVIDGAGGSVDRVVANRASAEFVLGDSFLSSTGFGTLNLVSVEAADLQAAVTADNSFDVSLWSGTGRILAAQATTECSLPRMLRPSLCPAQLSQRQVGSR